MCGLILERCRPVVLTHQRVSLYHRVAHTLQPLQHLALTSTFFFLVALAPSGAHIVTSCFLSLYLFPVNWIAHHHDRNCVSIECATRMEPELSPTMQFMQQCWADGLSAARARHGLSPDAISPFSRLSALPHPSAGGLDDDLHCASKKLDDSAEKRSAPREYGTEASQRRSGEDPSLYSPVPRQPYTTSSSAAKCDLDVANAHTRPLTIDRADSPGSRLSTSSQSQPADARDSARTRATSGAGAPSAQPAQPRRLTFVVDAQPNLVRGHRPAMGSNGVAWVVQ